eukprot:gnl/MRDRNA2_/MRDRNA2_84494_c0_seq1.p1 gnl/MRDRNA2_/MRDRNA2_84494_c0~~gnl/MRDRNA2_/MRDRNA2_84494_c0_seq1.p1  ORF type:complete len:106 (-),score=1.66 gnl/MRDRNA2_/MRDRNA2_84494_c0_seq1:51-368(-)
MPNSQTLSGISENLSPETPILTKNRVDASTSRCVDDDSATTSHALAAASHCSCAFLSAISNHSGVSPAFNCVTNSATESSSMFLRVSLKPTVICPHNQKPSRKPG